MKNASLSSFRCPRAAQGLLLTLALFTGGLAGAQNYVRNPNWAQPLGPTNWTVVYVNTANASVLRRRLLDCRPHHHGPPGRVLRDVGWQ